MTTKADYTDEEWAALRRAPLVAGLAVSFADPGGPITLSQDAMAHERENADLKHALDLKASSAREQIADELRRVAGIVSQKATPEEAAAFREWMLTAAQDAANAAKEGGFMGIGAVRVSEGEERMLATLRDILGLPAA